MNKELKDTPATEPIGEEVRPPDEVEKPQPDYYGQLLRLKAEFENYRKRVDREKPEYLRLGRVAVLAKLLPLYDLLRKAHEQVQAEHNDTPLAKGMDGIFKEFDKLFREEGVTTMDPLNKPFDALQHEVCRAEGAAAQMRVRGSWDRVRVAPLGRTQVSEPALQRNVA